MPRLVSWHACWLYIHPHTHTHTHIYIYIYTTQLAAMCIELPIRLGDINVSRVGGAVGQCCRPSTRRSEYQRAATTVPYSRKVSCLNCGGTTAFRLILGFPYCFWVDVKNCTCCLATVAWLPVALLVGKVSRLNCGGSAAFWVDVKNCTCCLATVASCPMGCR
jgi:hypothetical protein